MKRRPIERNRLCPTPLFRPLKDDPGGLSSYYNIIHLLSYKILNVEDVASLTQLILHLDQRTSRENLDRPDSSQEIDVLYGVGALLRSVLSH